ncbi:MAG: hypothetical protein ACO27R_03990 [Hylemonella sp.]
MTQSKPDKPKRYPIGGEPVEVFHTRLSLSDEAPRLIKHAERFNITLSAALRDLARRGMNLPSVFDKQP